MGVGLAVLRRSTNFLAQVLRRRMLVSLEIPNRDKAFEWFLAWQAQSARQSSTSRFIRSHELSLETSYQQHPNGSSEAVFNLVAGPGTHWFRYRGAWIQVCPIYNQYTYKIESFISIAGREGTRNQSHVDDCRCTLGDCQVDNPISRPKPVPRVIIGSARTGIERSAR